MTNTNKDSCGLRAQCAGIEKPANGPRSSILLAEAKAGARESWLVFASCGRDLAILAVSSSERYAATEPETIMEIMTACPKKINPQVFFRSSRKLNAGVALA
jgi:hypothetical protein